MKNIGILIGFLASSFFGYGQKILTIDLDQIKQKTEDGSSPYYYPTLVERFVKGDTSLGTEALQCLYYGATFRDLEDNSISDRGMKFLKHLRAEQYREAIPMGQAILKNNPIDIRTSFGMMICYDRLGIEDSTQLYAVRYYGLLHAISASGDGLTEETAMVVTKVPDEYEMLRAVGFASTEQALITGKAGATDKLTLDLSTQKKDPKVPALYFNVEISFIAMKKMFEGKLTLPKASETKK